MGNIVLLDDLTINKIAAGEVIERPASVIKEMLENSIDAGADKIVVEIRNGGISYIRITDNGKGISKDDLELAFERHATSKIRNANDLNFIKSMGFRGEALASIAAISNVELCSKTINDETGHRIVIEGGKILEQTECACQQGTTITVKNLFFNTPVRYKFLKKDFTESGYIEDAISRIALINPNISFKFINTGKTVIQTNGDGNINNVVFNIYGKEIARAILPIKYTYEDITINGVIGKKEIIRSNRGNQLFFVNKRYIKDKIITSAVDKAYKGLLPIGKYGFLILDIEMNTSEVDVNVHPEKLEVRFQNEGKIFKAVYNAVKDALIGNEMFSDETKNQYLNNDNTYKKIESNNAIIEGDFNIPKVAKTMTIEEVVSEKIEKEKKQMEENQNLKVTAKEDEDNINTNLNTFAKEHGDNINTNLNTFAKEYGDNLNINYNNSEKKSEIKDENSSLERKNVIVQEKTNILNELFGDIKDNKNNKLSNNESQEYSRKLVSKNNTNAELLKTNKPEILNNINNLKNVSENSNNVNSLEDLNNIEKLRSLNNISGDVNILNNTENVNYSNNTNSVNGLEELENLNKTESVNGIDKISDILDSYKSHINSKTNNVKSDDGLNDFKSKCDEILSKYKNLVRDNKDQNKQQFNSTSIDTYLKNYKAETNSILSENALVQNSDETNNVIENEHSDRINSNITESKKNDYTIIDDNQKNKVHKNSFYNVQNIEAIANTLSEKMHQNTESNIDNEYKNYNINNDEKNYNTSNFNNEDKNITDNSSSALIEQNKASNKSNVHENTNKIETIDETISRTDKSKNIQPKTTATNFKDMYDKIFGKVKEEKNQESIEEEINDNTVSAENIINNNLSLLEEDEQYILNDNKLNYKLIGIAFENYIIIEIKKELYIVNQQTAYERLVYEQIKENYYKDQNKDSQLLLLPDIINLSHKTMAIAKDNFSRFRKAGFQLEEFGENTIKLTGVPTICFNINTKDLFLDILDEIDKVARIDKKELEEKFLSTIAFNVSNKESFNNSNEELDNLLQRLLSLQNPFTYANGKPIAIKITKSDLEKKFARRK